MSVRPNFHISVRCTATRWQEKKIPDLWQCWISIPRRNMAGDPNTQIFNNVCVHLQNLSVKLLHSFAETLLCLSME
jgi:hypothetical protein